MLGTESTTHRANIGYSNFQEDKREELTYFWETKKWAKLLNFVSKVSMWKSMIEFAENTSKYTSPPLTHWVRTSWRRDNNKNKKYFERF